MAPPFRTSTDAPVQPGNDRGDRQRVTLVVGHCYVEPVRVEGQTWITKRTLIGEGGGIPRDFTPEGTFVVLSGSAATFIADGGANVGFKVAPSPLQGRSCASTAVRSCR